MPQPFTRASALAFSSEHFFLHYLTCLVAHGRQIQQAVFSSCLPSPCSPHRRTCHCHVGSARLVVLLNGVCPATCCDVLFQSPPFSFLSCMRNGGGAFLSRTGHLGALRLGVLFCGACDGTGHRSGEHSYPCSAHSATFVRRVRRGQDRGLGTCLCRQVCSVLSI